MATSKDEPRDGTTALDGAHTDFRDRANYADVLCLDTLLSCQKPILDDGATPAHDELLFVIIHQTGELWMKLVLHELGAAREAIRQDEIGTASKMLARVVRVFEQMSQAWDVLTTMTPADYLTFRDRLGQASGLQSLQYRMIAFLLGGKEEAVLAVHSDRPKARDVLAKALAEPSLYDETLNLLSRRGFEMAQTVLNRDWTQAYQQDHSVEAAWAKIYRQTDAHWELYELAEKFIDIEHALDTWRYHHVTTVERVIGYKRGTGGTSGVGYLRRALHHRFFPELWSVRTAL